MPFKLSTCFHGEIIINDDLVELSSQILSKVGQPASRGRRVFGAVPVGLITSGSFCSRIGLGSDYPMEIGK